jgi:hypothetical protein
LSLSDTQLRVHPDRLVNLEYLLVHRGARGQSFVYEQLYDGCGRDGQAFVPGLADLETLQAAVTAETSRGEDTDFAGPARTQGGANAPVPRYEESAADAAPARLSGPFFPFAAQTPISKGNGKTRPYPQVGAAASSL